MNQSNGGGGMVVDNSSLIVVMYNSSSFVMASENVASLTIGFVGLFIALIVVALSTVMWLHYVVLLCVKQVREANDMRKLKKQGASRMYYDSIKSYDGTVKFFSSSQPWVTMVSCWSMLVWYIGTCLYYNLIYVEWMGTEETNQVGTFTTRRIYCIVTYIWFHYILGSNVWIICLMGRLVSLFVWNLREDNKERINFYRKKQSVAMVTIILTTILVIATGVVHSVVMPFNTDGSYEELRPIVCNRLNSIDRNHPEIAQYDPNALALVFLQYLLIGTAFLMWILLTFVHQKRCCCQQEVPNVLFKRVEYYVCLVALLLYFAIVTEFNVVSFLFGYNDVSIFDIPAGVRYSNVLAIPLLEWILFFGINFNIIFRAYLTCNWKSIRNYQTEDDLQSKNHLVFDKSYDSSTSKTNLRSSMKSNATTLSNISTARFASNTLEMEDSQNFSNATLNASLRGVYVTSPSSSRMRDEPPPLHGYEIQKKRTSIRSNRSSVRTTSEATSSKRSSIRSNTSKRSDSRVHFLTLE